MGPGWYFAPNDAPGYLRWWDGYQWTGHVTQAHALGAAPTDPGTAFSPRDADPCGTLPERVSARIVDAVVLGILVAGGLRMVGPALLHYLADVESPATTGTGVFDQWPIMTMVALLFVVPTLWELIWLVQEGATPGKQLLGLYVDDDNTPSIGPMALSGQVAAKRSLHRPLNLIPYVGTALVGIFSAVSLVFMQRDTETSKSPMDSFAATTVRRVPAGTSRILPWLSVCIRTLIVTILVGVGIDVVLL